MESFRTRELEEGLDLGEPRSGVESAGSTWLAEVLSAMEVDSKRLQRTKQIAGAQHALIANAVALPERLLVTTCAMENVSVPWDALPALARLPVGERDQFQVEEFGSYLHWPAADVHLDVEALRVAVDPVWKAQATAALRAHNERLGRAMRALREDAGLDQRAIVGLSERQVRRVEKGEVQPRVSTYEAFAAAHQMALAAYLDAVAARAR